MDFYLKLGRKFNRFFNPIGDAGTLAIKPLMFLTATGLAGYTVMYVYKDCISEFERIEKDDLEAMEKVKLRRAEARLVREKATENP